ncbi:MAG: PD-(D/E)XK nuclease family transposase [Butyricimonas paravirosa]
MEKDRYIRFDWAVKRLLRDKANFGVLEGLLTVLLGKEIHIMEILESESNQQCDNDKFNRVDIKARNSEEIIIVEVQITRSFISLNVFFTGRRTIRNILSWVISIRGEKVYSISILYFDIGKGMITFIWAEHVHGGSHGDRLQAVKERMLWCVAYLRGIPEYFLIFERV